MPIEVAPELRAELSAVLDLCDIADSTGDFAEGFVRVMRVLARHRAYHRACMLLLDEATGKLSPVASFGLTGNESDKGRYLPGEGVIGHVAETGRPRVINDVRKEPDFLNRTGRQLPESESSPLSFVCVPLRLEGYTIGVIWADKTFEGEADLQLDLALLEIVGAIMAQAVRVERMVMRDRKEFLASTAEFRSKARENYNFEGIIGDAPAMQEVFATVGQVASSRATVLLLGETGTGKEMIAKAIHMNSPRRNNAFIRVNCGALTGTLLESELFGHARGSFTGAIRDKLGRFEMADGGTIFLDEIGTLSPELQVKLLRVLQEREVERVGEGRPIKIDVRVIAATNLDLQEEVRKENFREDLYYRLNVVSIYLPPLRNRREDIPKLVDFFLTRYNQINGRKLKYISKDVMSTLLRYNWPGNVRELENAIERAVVLSRDEYFTEDLLPLSLRTFAAERRLASPTESIQTLTRKLADLAVADLETREGEIYQLVMEQVERSLIERALVRCEGVKIKAADYLGINRNTLNKKVKELGIESD